jgi:hypothetical protein
MFQLARDAMAFVSITAFTSAVCLAAALVG